MTLLDLIISLLKRSPADQYSLYRQIDNAPMAEIIRAIVELQNKKIIHVIKYRKNKRTGLGIPIYSLSAGIGHQLDIHPLLAGITSERIVEYDFVARNLCSPSRKATILDLGSAGSELVQTLRDYGKKWSVFGVDLLQESDTVMDARSAGFRDKVFDQVICISTMEHIGLAGGIMDREGDDEAMREIFRMLKNDSSAIVTVPYGTGTSPNHRIYNRTTLANLVSLFSVVLREFYRYDGGKWEKCSQAAAGRSDSKIPHQFHGAACACLLLKKK